MRRYVASLLDRASKALMPSWGKRAARVLILPIVLALAGCASYQPKPLPQGPDLARTAKLEIPTKKLTVPGLAPHPFNAADGLDLTEVVTLAVLNNPDLKAKRLQAGVAAAQLLQAGLLPNPQLSASLLRGTGGPPPLVTGYSVGLMQDLTKLVTRGAAVAGARAHAEQVDLNILWQEWQVAEKARRLYIKARAEMRLRDALNSQKTVYANKYRRDQKALRQGNLTLSTTSADLVLLVNANTQLRQLERRRNRTRHALDALLGLKPEVKPQLTGTPGIKPLSKARFQSAVAHLPRRRPDLIALRAGYQSQEQAVRKAILNQFPALSAGPTQGTDATKVQSFDFGITLSLPLFNHNQGRIAIQRATRAQLRQAYQARLDQAVNQASMLWRKVNLIHRQLQQLDARLPALKHTTQAAKRAFMQANLSAGAYIKLRSALLAKQIEVIQLKASLQQTQAALETLLGMTLEAAAPTPEVGSEA